ncbi:MAG: DUF3857 and transglutaminase domain-containing protein [Saprospiraceae bacterium]|nr:DUF3857 and transglutaminase domain-containing protein [Saprospiraceae bacterium]
MLRYLFLIATLFYGSGMSLAQDAWPVSSIDPELFGNANAVVRLYTCRFEVLNSGEAVETELRVVTLLNENAASETEQVFTYDNIVRIEEIEGAVYDASGQLVRRIRKKEIEDVKYLEYFVNDNRMKVLHFPRLAYPYTIEYKVVRRYNGLMFYPLFEPQGAPDQSVEVARFEVQMPTGLELRYKERNVPENSKIGPSHWEFLNLKAYDPEPFTPEGHNHLPAILTAPSLFSLEGYDGDMRNWKSFGQFIQALNTGKGNLPAATVEKIRQITADCQDVVCKARRVYAYLQDNTRYFFVGLGLGGWQPMPAGEVDRTKYSDCKGLSNYMVALLRAAGVEGYYTLIRATAEAQKAQFPDFPNAWFNHVIVCVPAGSDTLWLECTSQTESFGFLSDFTDDRPALIITPDGGQLTRTPKYDESVNVIQRTTRIDLTPDGSAAVHSEAVFRGIAQNLPASLAAVSQEQQRQYLYDRLPVGDFDIKTLTFERKNDRLPEVRQTLEINLPRLATPSGKRLFLPLTIFSEKQIAPPPAGSKRRFPVQAHARGVTEEDELFIALPEGFALENPVPEIALSAPFGQYTLSLQVEEHVLHVRRRLVLTPAVCPKEQYETLVEFLQNVAKADKTKAVLVR